MPGTRLSSSWLAPYLKAFLSPRSCGAVLRPRMGRHGLPRNAIARQLEEVLRPIAIVLGGHVHPVPWLASSWNVA